MLNYFVFAEYRDATVVQQDARNDSDDVTYRGCLHSELPVASGNGPKAASVINGLLLFSAKRNRHQVPVLNIVT